MQISLSKGIYIENLCEHHNFRFPLNTQLQPFFAVLSIIPFIVNHSKLTYKSEPCSV